MLRQLSLVSLCILDKLLSLYVLPFMFCHDKLLQCVVAAMQHYLLQVVCAEMGSNVLTVDAIPHSAELLVYVAVSIRHYLMNSIYFSIFIIS